MQRKCITGAIFCRQWASKIRKKKILKNFRQKSGVTRIFPVDKGAGNSRSPVCTCLVYVRTTNDKQIMSVYQYMFLSLLGKWHICFFFFLFWLMEFMILWFSWHFKKFIQHYEINIAGHPQILIKFNIKKLAPRQYRLSSYNKYYRKFLEGEKIVTYYGFLIFSLFSYLCLKKMVKISIN